MMLCHVYLWPTIARSERNHSSGSNVSCYVGITGILLFITQSSEASTGPGIGECDLHRTGGFAEI